MRGMNHLTSGHLSRRSFLAAAGAISSAALFSGCAIGRVARNIQLPAYPFQLGVASGDPASESVVLWTRLAPLPLEGGGMPDENVQVEWQVAEDEAMGKVVRKGKVAARPEWGHSVHVEVDGLRPDRWYWYQFKAAGEISPKGRTRTSSPVDSLPARVRFAFASCQHYESGYYTAYQHMLREDLDLVIHLGDYIYEGAARENQVRQHVGPELMTLEHYRNRLAQYRTDPALQAMHAAAPWLVTWDDHEVDNNYAAEISEEANVSPEQLLTRRAAAYQAYYEHMPLRRQALPKGPDMRLHRRVPFGRLVDFHVLDTRQYRTDQPCGDGNKLPCEESLNPDATLLGGEQRQWLMRGLERSPAQWNVLAQQVMMAPVDRKPGPELTRSMDQWPGYEAERRRLLEFFRQRKIANPVVLTGDIHTNWANELLASENPESEPVAAEFVGTSISSGGDGRQAPPSLSELLAENPFVKFHNTERGYVSCEITPREWKSHFRTVEYVTRPGAPLNTRASFALQNGSSRLLRI